jgi:uncharacterized NAD(P)/FAD-binding protein YdhS
VNDPDSTVVVIGGGLSGSLFGLKLSRARPDLRVVAVESGRRLGRGLAYGACTPRHLLNVPASRMELGLTPSFSDWLTARPDLTGEALEESGGDLSGAFLPRAVFGAYLQERLDEARTVSNGPGFAAVRGRASAILTGVKRGVRLEDGRTILAAAVVVAIGNLPPQPPGGPDGWFYDTALFTPDPWAPDAFADLDPTAPILLVGTGLTMVDVALKLADEGHTGPMLAVSRRGLAPLSHKAGGAWPPFLQDMLGASPLALSRRVRAEVAAAQAQGVPWQRVFDAARPAVGGIWSRWTQKQRSQFLRHLRARWDIHRHRTAPRIATALGALTGSGQLEIQGARLAGYAVEGDRVSVSLAPRGGGKRSFTAARVINCTGPASDLRRLALPLIEDLKVRNLAQPDALGLGLETQDCALVQPDGAISPWLFALGPVTRPAWWEITATPEIVVQIDRLVARFAEGQGAAPRPARGLTGDAFLDLGAGI